MVGSVVGYARVSTREQNPEAQEAELRAAVERQRRWRRERVLGRVAEPCS
ncbi:recombinase family protein [Serinibacter salmoneus]|nr:recombinase family protein [Serinibacter salmoneus]